MLLIFTDLLLLHALVSMVKPFAFILVIDRRLRQPDNAYDQKWRLGGGSLVPGTWHLTQFLRSPGNRISERIDGARLRA
jgi:hypothetical protein